MVKNDPTGKWMLAEYGIFSEPTAADKGEEKQEILRCRWIVHRDEKQDSKETGMVHALVGAVLYPQTLGLATGPHWKEDMAREC